MVLATADAYTKFLSKCTRGAATAIFREKVAEVAFFDEAQAYELDQAAACLSSGTVQTAILGGDPNQTVDVRQPSWTRQPWISKEFLTPPGERSEEVMVDVDIDQVVAAAGPETETEAQPSKFRMIVRNPRPRKIIDWLERRLRHVEQLKLSGCKRCGPVICGFVSKLFDKYCGDLEASSIAPDTKLTHYFYRCPWHYLGETPASAVAAQAVAGPAAAAAAASAGTGFQEVAAPSARHFKCMVNNVLFACLAAVIWNNLKEAALRGVLPSSSGPLVVVIVYLHRVAVPLQQFLLGVFKWPTLWDLGQGLAAYKDVPVEDLVKVMVLDSVRGITADYVHVIRGERQPGRQDQYWGIQADTHREYISYTRARIHCHVWLDQNPFGHPWCAEFVERSAAQPVTHQGFDHHVKRNKLIREQQLPAFCIEGHSWWHELWDFLGKGADWNEELSKAIEDAFRFNNVAESLNHKVQGGLPKYKDPLEAIQGVAKDEELRSFLSATLSTIRASGIAQAPRPIDLFDPDMEQRELFGVDWALRFAMAMAPALTADVRQGTQLTQLCIPTMRCSGLDPLGETLDRGERMLRAFVLAVKRVLDNSSLEPKAITHKAETVEILGERWFSKACRSDREACALVNSTLPKSKQRRVYCYLGGGGLSEASTWLAQGVVVRAKSWDEAAAVCTAVSLLTMGVPGPTVFLEPKFITTDKEFMVTNDGILDLDTTGGDAATADDPATGTEGQLPNPVEELMMLYQVKLTLLAFEIGLPVEAHMPHSPLQGKSVAEAQAYKEQVWRFFNTEPAG